MPASAAIIGHTTTFYVETTAGSSPSFTKLGEVTAISPPGATTDAVDVTHMESADGIREFIPGLTDPGEVSLTLNWIPGDTTDDFILAWSDKRACKIRFPNGVTWTFDGFKTSFQPDTPMDDKMTAELTVKASGSTVTGVQT
ncbi:phage tail tube protein [Phenylobacterium sp.]|uniref:phage tail tube protein n=1 Tax=Phenylobacterium sp. TaxID=1871053 RepID=UPI00391C7126